MKVLRGPARSPDLAPASGANALGSADPPPLTTSSSQSENRRHLWLDALEDDNPRLRKLFSEDSAGNVDVDADLPVAIGPSSGAIADAILHDPIFHRRPSPARLDFSSDFHSALPDAARVPRLTAVSSSVLKRSASGLPLMPSVFVASSRPSTARPGCSHRLRGVCGFVSLPS